MGSTRSERNATERKAEAREGKEWNGNKRMGEGRQGKEMKRRR